MPKKYIILLVVIIAISGVVVLEYTQGTMSALAFDQMKYNFSSHVLIPPSDANGSSLGGYYIINATGRDFDMVMVLSNAEKSESPLDYTADGLHVTGRIDTIKANLATIIALYNHDVKTAMFNTDFTGTMNMTCAAWTGTSKFQNKNKNFTGTFKIIGTMTDWEGKYTLNQNSEQIVLTSDFIYYPHNNKTPENINYVHKFYYL
jgi:hypothetical protein